MTTIESNRKQSPLILDELLLYENGYTSDAQMTDKDKRCKTCMWYVGAVGDGMHNIARHTCFWEARDRCEIAYVYAPSHMCHKTRR